MSILNAQSFMQKKAKEQGGNGKKEVFHSLISLKREPVSATARLSKRPVFFLKQSGQRIAAIRMGIGKKVIGVWHSSQRKRILLSEGKDAEGLIFTSWLLGVCKAKWLCKIFCLRAIVAVVIISPYFLWGRWRVLLRYPSQIDWQEQCKYFVDLLWDHLEAPWVLINCAKPFWPSFLFGYLWAGCSRTSRPTSRVHYRLICLGFSAAFASCRGWFVICPTRCGYRSGFGLCEADGFRTHVFFSAIGGGDLKEAALSVWAIASWFEVVL